MKPLTTTGRARGRPLHRRRQMKTRRKWTWRSLLHAPIPQLVLLVMVLGGLYALATSRVFAISEVQVVGDAGLPATLLRQHCACVGANIFLTRPSDVRQRLSSIIWLDIHQVFARLPDRLVIDASYRRPVLLWRTVAATYTVDSAGAVLYGTTNPPVPASMIPTTATVPIIFDPTGAKLTSGQRLPVEAIAMVRQLRAQLAPDLAPSVDRFRWDPGVGLSAHSSKGWWFVLGTAQGDDLTARLSAVDRMYRQGVMAQQHCNYIDVRPLAYPYCRYSLQWHSKWGPGTT